MNWSFADYCACPRCFQPLVQNTGELRCQGCDATYEINDGIAMLLPPRETQTQTQYRENYEKIAGDDLHSPLESTRTIRHEQLLRFIGNTKGLRVLDIGSSDAAYLQALDADLKVALDLAHPYLTTIDSTSGIHRICADAEYLPIGNGCFDLIIISDVLEHLLCPKRLVERLKQICSPDTTVLVHIPWREDLAQYQQSPYEFTHLRNFNSFSMAILWHDFYIEQARSTMPSLEEPLIFQLEARIPRTLYNLLVYAYFHGGRSSGEYKRRERWINDLPKRERWLLRFYKPKFRMFKLRLVRESKYVSFYQRVRWLFDCLGREERTRRAHSDHQHALPGDSSSIASGSKGANPGAQTIGQNDRQ